MSLLQGHQFHTAKFCSAQAYVARGRLQFAKPLNEISELKELSLMVILFLLTVITHNL
jgi:hypothetical protein